MLSCSGPIPAGDYAYELKFDGFRAIVGRDDGFRVSSRRGWNMTDRLPELSDLPAGCGSTARSSHSTTACRTSRLSATDSCTATDAYL